MYLPALFVNLLLIGAAAISPDKQNDPPRRLRRDPVDDKKKLDRKLRQSRLLEYRRLIVNRGDNERSLLGNGKGKGKPDPLLPRSSSSDSKDSESKDSTSNTSSDTTRRQLGRRLPGKGHAFGRGKGKGKGHAYGHGKQNNIGGSDDDNSIGGSDDDISIGGSDDDTNIGGSDDDNLSFPFKSASPTPSPTVPGPDDDDGWLARRRALGSRSSVSRSLTSEDSSSDDESDSSAENVRGRRLGHAHGVSGNSVDQTISSGSSGDRRRKRGRRLRKDSNGSRDEPASTSASTDFYRSLADTD